MKEFKSNFVTCLSLAFVSSSDSNSGVDQIIKFTTKFLISICELNTSSEDDELPEEAMQLLFDVFDFLNDVNTITLFCYCQLPSKLILHTFAFRAAE